MAGLHATQQIERLTPLTDALASIERLVTAVAPRRVPCRDALSRICASGLTGATAHPAAAIALRDGMAVRAEATLDASSYAPVAIVATPVEVGDPLPAGADAVVPADALEWRGATAHVVAPLAPGDGVLPAGGDIAAGEPLRDAARRLRAVDLAAFGILGLTDIDVRVPRVLIAAASAGCDGVIAAIIGLLARAIEAAGGTVSRDGAFDASGEDALILVGGSGMGRRDQTVLELARRGQVAFHGVGLAPGETAAFGLIERRPVLVVPGRLDAALAVWLTLGRCMLAKLAGAKENEPSETGVLMHKITSTLGLAELVPMMRHGGRLMPLASGYLTLQSLARAEGYVLVSADSEGFPAGATVEMRPLP